MNWEILSKIKFVPLNPKVNFLGAIISEDTYFKRPSPKIKGVRTDEVVYYAFGGMGYDDLKSGMGYIKDGLKLYKELEKTPVTIYERNNEYAFLIAHKELQKIIVVFSSKKVAEKFNNCLNLSDMKKTKKINKKYFRMKKDIENCKKKIKSLEKKKSQIPINAIISSGVLSEIEWKRSFEEEKIENGEIVYEYNFPNNENYDSLLLCFSDKEIRNKYVKKLKLYLNDTSIPIDKKMGVAEQRKRRIMKENNRKIGKFEQDADGTWEIKNDKPVENGKIIDEIEKI